MNKFSVFAEPSKILCGEKIKIADVLNVDIVVTGYRFDVSKYGKNKSGKCLTLQIIINKKTHVIFTGSDVLIDLVEKYSDKIPFETKIKKIDKYLTFS